jgi:acyl-CoA reductase-like NAD-dependent aldehyde dehydrogenase
MPTTQTTPAGAGAPAAYDGLDRMLLNGRWTHGRSGQSFEDVDPYTNDVLLRIPLADQADLDDAFAAAAAAQPAWSRAQPATRAAVLRRAGAIMESRRAEIVDWLVHESGSTRIKAELEWNMARAVTLEASSFPSAAEGVMLAADIPGKESRIYRQPVGVVGMIGPWNFRGAVFGKFLHQGQICMAINRLIVDASIHDDFVDRFKARVSRLKCGNPAEPDTVVGPIINRQQLQRLLERVEQARAAGARQILGGTPQGLVLPPQVFVDASNGMSVAAEELFGPVVAVIKVHGEDDALRVANETSYGLSAAVFTRDVERGNRFAQRLQAGMTHVNDSPVNDLPNCPFGGEKNSGLGRYNGRWSIEEFTTVHWISVQHEPAPYPF